MGRKRRFTKKRATEAPDRNALPGNVLDVLLLAAEKQPSHHQTGTSVTQVRGFWGPSADVRWAVSGVSRSTTPCSWNKGMVTKAPNLTALPRQHCTPSSLCLLLLLNSTHSLSKQAPPNTYSFSAEDPIPLVEMLHSDLWQNSTRLTVQKRKELPHNYIRTQRSRRSLTEAEQIYPQHPKFSNTGPGVWNTATFATPLRVQQVSSSICHC